jgi:hypothetical protein
MLMLLLPHRHTGGGLHIILVWRNNLRLVIGHQQMENLVLNIATTWVVLRLLMLRLLAYFLRKVATSAQPLVGCSVSSGVP